MEMALYAKDLKQSRAGILRLVGVAPTLAYSNPWSELSTLQN